MPPRSGPCRNEMAPVRGGEAGATCLQGDRGIRLQTCLHGGWGALGADAPT